MGEVQFAKQFLTTLDSKNTKYQPDHVFDPQTFETRIPYTLPKLPHPPHPLPPSSQTDTAPPPPGSTAAVPKITVILKSTRNPALSLTLTSLDPTTTTLQSLRDSVQSTLGGPSVVSSTDKIKLLWNRKPIPASKKTVSEALDSTAPDSKTATTSGAAEEEIELGVMIMGGAPDPPSQPASIPPTPVVPPLSEPVVSTADPEPTTEDRMEGVEPSGAAQVLAQSAFWTDLQAYLEERIKDAAEAKRVHGLFEGAWKAAGS